MVFGPTVWRCVFNHLHRQTLNHALRFETFWGSGFSSPTLEKATVFFTIKNPNTCTHILSCAWWQTQVLDDKQSRTQISKIHHKMHVLFSFITHIFFGVYFKRNILTFSFRRYTNLPPTKKKYKHHQTQHRTTHHPKNLRLGGDRCFELPSKHRSFEAPRSEKSQEWSTFLMNKDDMLIGSMYGIFTLIWLIFLLLKKCPDL